VQAILAASPNDQVSGLDLALVLGFGLLALFALMGVLAFFSWTDPDRVLARAHSRAMTARARGKWSRADITKAIAGSAGDQASAVDAVRELMEAELTDAVKQIRSDSIKIGIVSFIAGGGLTFAVTLLVHPLN
jgi:hypothetical protein